MLLSALVGRLERAQALDPAVDAASGVMNRVLPRGRFKDLLHGTWLGHPVHPLAVALPIGLWSGALLLDLTGGDRASARRLVGAGVLAAVPTAASGWADWSELGVAKRPKRVGLVHAGANALTIFAFAGSWLARRDDDAAGRGLALAGAAGLTVGGYLGGHLAYSQAVGVNRNADEVAKPREWTDACAADDLVEGTPLRVEVSGQAVVLVRSGAALSAIGATCSHWGGPLDEGRLVDGCIECPWHASRFRLSDGSVAQGPATAAQRAYDVRTAGERLEV
ncbi:MAG: Ferredoxin, 2Fe-2S, partial [uncultured Frankineae bacterium]